jgi:signal transduction histidine kinase
MSLDGRVGHTTVIDEILRGAADGRTVDQVSYWVGEGSNQRSMVASSKIVRRPSGEILGTVIATQDVTPLSDSLRARDEFLKMLSHDMRSPLTSIIGYLEVIEDSVDVHRAGIAVELAIIRRNAARLLALAEDIRHSTNASDLSTQAHDRLPERETRAPISPSDLHELRVGDLN